MIESGALVVATSAPTTASNQMPLLRRTFWPQLRSPEVGFVSTASGDALQGDVAFAEVLGAWVAVSTLVPAMSRCPGERVGVEVDLSDISDTAPTLAVVAAFADSPTRVDGIGFIRDKESDRVAGPVTELRRPVSMRRNTTTALPSALRAAEPRHLRHL